MPSAGKLGEYEVGQIRAFRTANYSQRDIAASVLKSDGKKGINLNTVVTVLQKLRQNPRWTGKRKKGSGRARKTTKAQDRKLVKSCLQHRGRVRVHSKILKRLQRLQVSVWTIRRRLKENGLHFLRRRRKTMVPPLSVKARIIWAYWVLRLKRAYLRRWVYTDGVSFYLARTMDEQDEAVRLALGPFCWRYATSRDAMHQDCVGPSAYRKAQGLAVRCWGLLNHGRLYLHVFPEGTYMNRFMYRNLILRKFKKWCRGVRSPLLVQDYEKCLRSKEARAAFKKVKITVLDQHCKHSADLNASENAWAILRARLAETVPLGKKTWEKRPGFVRRLQRAVIWVNKNKRKELINFARNQRRRARDVLANKGHRTEW